MTTDCTPARFSCPIPYGTRLKHIEAEFSGGTITSHAGLLLAGLAEGHMRLFDRIAECFADFRNSDLIVHEVRSMIGQRILGLIAGLEDLSDHNESRKDPVAGVVLGCMTSRRQD